MEAIPVKVAVRCRALLGAGEELAGFYENLQCDKQGMKINIDDKIYKFDAVFDASSSQEDIYHESVVSLVNKFLSGSNAAVIAYGQTGSGKTFTMGTDADFNSIAELDDEHVGIIPRTLRQIFSFVSNEPCAENNRHSASSVDSTIKLKVSFFEVHNEEVYDLLNPQRPRVIIRQEEHNVKLCGLIDREVSSLQGAMECLKMGSRIRTTGATAMNNHSSRSHAVFSINRENGSSNDHDQSANSHMMMVDLAGSEVVRQTKTSGARFREGININRGLFTLGKVINALSQRKGRGHVPYRDSTLTRILQRCLQRNCYSLLISCISPMEGSVLETNSTLCFASHARDVKVCIVQSTRTEVSSHKKLPPSGGVAGPRTFSDRRGPSVPRLGNYYTPSSVTKQSSMTKLKESTAGDSACGFGVNVDAFKLPISLPNLEDSSIIDDSVLEATVIHKGETMEGNGRLEKPELESTRLPLSVEAKEPAVFQIPVTPIQRNTIPHEYTAHSFSPLMRRICATIETSMCDVANRMISINNPLSTPIRESLADAVVRRISASHVTFLQPPQQDSVNARFGAQQNVTVDYPKMLSDSTMSSCTRGKENESPVLRHASHRSSSSIGSLLHSRASVLREDVSARMVGQFSVTMSPNNSSNHTQKILDILNKGTVRQLQQLPCVGPKTAIIIYNWRIGNGQLQSMDDLRQIAGLASGFHDRFIRANMCDAE